MKPPSTDAQTEGRLWHAAITGDMGDVVLVEADSFRTKEAREFRDQAIADGKTPMIAAKWQRFRKGAERIREEMGNVGVVLDGNVEERFEWSERASDGTEVLCSGVVDHRSELYVDDLKTSAQAYTPDRAAREIANSHALLQDAAYRHAVAQHENADIERCSMRFVFVQTVEPHVVVPVVLDGEFRQLSELRWQRSIDIWARCLKQGTERDFWPGPVSGTVDVHAPGWMMAQELEMEEMG
jgi:hypothetical protein